MLYEREQTFVGSNSCAEQFEPAAEFIQDIQVQVGHMIGDAFDVWDFEEAVSSMDKGLSIKTQLRFR